MSLLEEATSAAAGAVFSTSVLYPLEIAKTQLVSKTGGSNSETTLGILQRLLKTGGVSALYKGLPAKSTHASLQTFLYFYLYTLAKKLILIRARYMARKAAAAEAIVSGASVAASVAAPQIGTLANIGAGYVAAIAGLGLTLPLEVVTTQVQLAASDTSVGAVVKNISSKEGLSGFYRGFQASLFLCLNPAINYTIFEQLKARWLRITKSSSLSVMQAFVLGVIAKIVATLATYPQIRAKLVQQSGTYHDPDSSITEIIQHIWKTEGPLGLYKGLQAQLVRTVLASALMLTAKEQIAERTSKILRALRR